MQLCSRMSMCADIGRRCLGALDNLTMFKRAAKKWDNRWADENDEAILYGKHLHAQREMWTAADALASTTVRMAEGNSKSDMEECQARGNSWSEEGSSQCPSIKSLCNNTQVPAGDVPDTATSWRTLRCQAQTTIRNNKLHISKCETQSQETANEVLKENFNIVAQCLTAYSNQLERLYLSQCSMASMV